METRAHEDWYEYLLMVRPDEAVSDKIISEREEFHRQHPSTVFVKSRPAITIGIFKARDEMEDTIIRWMQRIMGDQKSFLLSLNNFSGTPSHSIFLRLQDQSAIKLLREQLKPVDTYIKGNSCPPVQFITNPNILIAQQLPIPIYENVIHEYSQKTFHDSFEVNELVLLRRKHSHDAPKQVAIFRMQAVEHLI